MRQERLIGYARVSTNDQDLALQLDALKHAGCERRWIFTDKISGAKSERKGFDKCIAELREGDTLVVWRIDRLGRSLSHLVETVTGLRKRGVGFRSLQEGMIDTTSASGELVFGIFSVLAQFERRLIQERTKAGLDAARSRGRMGGRRPVADTDAKVQMVKALARNKLLSIDDICTQLSISRATYYRYLALGDNSNGSSAGSSEASSDQQDGSGLP